MKMTCTMFRHSPDMGEISGMGEGYEKNCQDMLEAGVTWLNERMKDPMLPPIELTAKGIKNVYGILSPESDDAKILSKVIVSAVEDCTGAMHQAVMTRLFYIAHHGWEKYCETMRESEKKRQENLTPEQEEANKKALEGAKNFATAFKNHFGEGNGG